MALPSLRTSSNVECSPSKIKDRVHYGFEYLGIEDPTRMSSEELSDEEVLTRVQKILKGVDCLPREFDEYNAEHPPPSISVEPILCYR